MLIFHLSLLLLRALKRIKSLSKYSKPSLTMCFNKRSIYQVPTKSFKLILLSERAQKCQTIQPHIHSFQFPLISHAVCDDRRHILNTWKSLPIKLALNLAVSNLYKSFESSKCSSGIEIFRIQRNTFKLTNPYPLDFPVCLSVITTASSMSP